MVEATNTPQLGLAQAMAIVEAMGGAAGEWVHGDDLCDCTFQRIQRWTNPYLAETLVVRWCCLCEELYRQFPQFVQRVDAYHDLNTGEYHTAPRPWDADHDMPRHIWHRQLAKQHGLTLAEVRARYGDQEPPKAVVASN